MTIWRRGPSRCSRSAGRARTVAVVGAGDQISEELGHLAGATAARPARVSCAPPQLRGRDSRHRARDLLRGLTDGIRRWMSRSVGMRSDLRRLDAFAAVNRSWPRDRLRQGTSRPRPGALPITDLGEDLRRTPLEPAWKKVSNSRTASTGRSSSRPLRAARCGRPCFSTTAAVLPLLEQLTSLGLGRVASASRGPGRSRTGEGRQFRGTGARSSRSLPATCRIARTCAEPPTRDDRQCRRK